MSNREAKRWRKMWRGAVKAKADMDINGIVKRYKMMRRRYYGLVVAVAVLATAFISTIILYNI